MADQYLAEREISQFIAHYNWRDRPRIHGFIGDEPGLHQLFARLLFDKAPMDSYRNFEKECPNANQMGLKNRDHAHLLLSAIVRVMRLGCFRINVLWFLLVKYPILARIPMYLYENGNRDLLLHIACECVCDMDLYELMLEIHPQACRTRGRQDMLPLHVACASTTEHAYKRELIELLVSYHPAALCTPSMMHGTALLPLHHAVMEQSDDTIMLVLDYFPQAAAFAGLEKQLPIHSACDRSSSFELIQKLVHAHPDGVHARCNRGDLPLHKAVFKLDRATTYAWGLYYVVKFLVELHPEGVRCRNYFGQLPLHRAMRAPLKVIEQLLDMYPDAVCAKDHDGNLPLHHACSFSHKGSCVEAIQLLLRRYQGDDLHNCGLNVADNLGRLPLHCTALGHDIETMQFVLQQFPQAVSVAGISGWLPIHTACLANYSDTEFIRILCDANPIAMIQKTNDGETPFQLAYDTMNLVRQEHDVDREFFVEKQDEAIELVKAQVSYSMGTQLGLPDLVVANVWAFAKPDLWVPPSE